jgi:hypothetical protein
VDIHPVAAILGGSIGAPSILRMLAGEIPLSRADAPLVLATASQDLLVAHFHMSVLDVRWPTHAASQKGAKPKCEEVGDPIPVGLAVYLLTPAGLKAGLTTDDVEHLARSVAMLMVARGLEDPHIPRLAAERLADSHRRRAREEAAKKPKPAAGPRGAAENEAALMGVVASAWGG